MTLPDERYRAVLRAEQFLKDLLDPTKTPRVPRSIRTQAAGVLRHYPGVWDMNRAAWAAPEVFETLTEPDRLYKMVKDYRYGLDPEYLEDLNKDQ